ncbi:hypothetical protein B4113_2494 [Geobacillus sp. B4113_201601]|nr:hypothetical protein B4113_2494 [Geobacillus sp. B4113_201601]
MAKSAFLFGEMPLSCSWQLFFTGLLGQRFCLASWEEPETPVEAVDLSGSAFP